MLSTLLPNLWGLASISFSLFRAFESSFGGRYCYRFADDFLDWPPPPMPPNKDFFLSSGRNFLICEQWTF